MKPSESSPAHPPRHPHTRPSPEGGLHLVDEAMYLQVDVLVQREELDALKHAEQVQFAHIQGEDILDEGEEDR